MTTNTFSRVIRAATRVIHYTSQSKSTAETDGQEHKRQNSSVGARSWHQVHTYEISERIWTKFGIKYSIKIDQQSPYATYEISERIWTKFGIKYSIKLDQQSPYATYEISEQYGRNLV